MRFPVEGREGKERPREDKGERKETPHSVLDQQGREDRVSFLHPKGERERERERKDAGTAQPVPCGKIALCRWNSDSGGEKRKKEQRPLGGKGRMDE